MCEECRKYRIILGKMKYMLEELVDIPSLKGWEEIIEIAPLKDLKENREIADGRLIKEHLLACRGNLSIAAKTLGIDRGTLRIMLRRYGIASDFNR